MRIEGIVKVILSSLLFHQSDIYLYQRLLDIVLTSKPTLLFSNSIDNLHLVLNREGLPDTHIKGYLCKDTTDPEVGAVLFKGMGEGSRKDLEVLDPSIEGLMALSEPFAEEQR